MATKNDQENYEFGHLNKKDTMMLRYMLENGLDTVKTKELASIFNVTPRAITKWCTNWVDRDILTANHVNVRMTSYSMTEKYKKLT